MAPPLRTNPAFAHLAYRKTIINRTISVLRRNYLGDEISEPRETLICEEVFTQDSHVPQEAVQHYLESLQDEVADIDVQLRRFKLVEPIEQRHQGHHGKKRQKGPSVQHPKGGTQNGKVPRAQ